MNPSRFFFYIFIATALAAYGCNSSTNPAITTVTSPGVGSVFILRSSDIDSSGAVVDSTIQFDTLTVVAKGIAYMGKTNVIQFRTPHGTNIYHNFEANGDLSLYYPNNGWPGYQAGWVTISMAANSVSKFNSVDTTIMGQRDTQTIVYTYQDVKDRVLGGYNFHTVDFIYGEFGYGTPDGSYGSTTEWISPTAGLLVGLDRPPYHLTNGAGWENGYHGEVFSVLIK